MKRVARELGMMAVMSLVAFLVGCGPGVPQLDLSGHWSGQLVGKPGDEFSGIAYQLDLYLSRKREIISQARLQWVMHCFLSVFLSHMA